MPPGSSDLPSGRVTGLRRCLIACLGLSVAAIGTWLLAYLALVDIWQRREPDLKTEWFLVHLALVLLFSSLAVSVPALLVAVRRLYVSNAWMILALATAAAVAGLLDLRALSIIASSEPDIVGGSWRIVSIGFVPIGLFLISNVSVLAGAVRDASIRERVESARSQNESPPPDSSAT